jgi:hypothetical protein
VGGKQGRNKTSVQRKEKSIISPCKKAIRKKKNEFERAIGLVPALSSLFFKLISSGIN